MSNASETSESGSVRSRLIEKEPRTPRSQPNTHLLMPLAASIPLARLSPALDEFSLRRTISRGCTASPTPAKGVRKRLHQYRNFDHAVELLKQSSNIIVLTGAGISTSVGIPDFRSDKGLYSQLSKDLGITEAEEFFSRDYFIHNTDNFFQYVKRVIPEAVIGSDGSFKPTNPTKTAGNGLVSVPRFSPTHAFLTLLQSKRKLLTNYTQNIDGLEIAAGLPRAKFIQCHGSWDTATCMTCGRSSAARKYLPIVFAGNIPFCKCKLEANQKSRQRKGKKASKKRSWDDFDSDHSSDDGTQAPRGLLKPDITFFNERLSGSYNDRLNNDKRSIDLLIIIGTSLKVGPVQDMLYQISPRVPQIFISKERFSGALCNLPGVQVDIELLGECDVIIEELCRRADWSQDLERLLWEEGQTKVKALTGLSAILQSKQLGRNNEDNISGQTMYQTSNEVNAKVSGISKENLRPDIQKKSNSGTLTIRGDASTPAITKADTLGYSQDSTETIALLHDQNLQPDGNESSKKLKTTVIEQQDNSTQGTQATTMSPSSRSHVKIELVEGTTHQWRVTKRA